MPISPLSREEIIRVIEGKGCAKRVPLLYHMWIYPDAFSGEKRAAVEDILSHYPMDVQTIDLRIPSVYDAPSDEPSYRWSYRDPRRELTALDNAGIIEDWDEELDLLLADFPSPDSPHLIPPSPPADGRYRLGKWWYFFFERFWSIRSMEDALTDFYLNPDAVHALFQKLADFYKRMLTRAKEELNLDGIFTSDDLGTQTSTFFSPAIFDEFFYPYYKQVIDHAHSLGMHFWLHACGNIESLIPRFIDLGIDVLHPIQKHTMDEKKIAADYGDRICIWSGFDVQQTIPYGTPEDVRREVRFLIDAYRRSDGRFMLTLGNGSTGDTPVESLEALFEESISYGKGSSSITIIPYTLEKIPDVMDFEIRLREEEPFYRWDIDEKYLIDMANSFFDPRFDGCISLLAEEDGKIIGRIDCTLVPSRFDGSIKAYLDWLCVIKSHRHKGAAQMLMNALRAELRTRNVDTLVAVIAANDEAQRFYRSIEGAEIRDEGMWLKP